jgi:RNA polymerase sigma factor FliA
VSTPADSQVVLDRFHGELDLVRIIARQVQRAVGPAVSTQELESYGREGLLAAARRFDAERGVPFHAYASLRVRGAVLDGVRASMPMPRRAHERLRALRAANRYEEGIAEDTYSRADRPPSPAEADRGLCDHLAAMATAMAIGMVSTAVQGEEGEPTALAPDDTPEEALHRAQLLERVRRAIDELPHQEAELVRRHYLQGERFDQVAVELGLSKSWASRLHSRAVARLTKYFGASP